MKILHMVRISFLVGVMSFSMVQAKKDREFLQELGVDEVEKIQQLRSSDRVDLKAIAELLRALHRRMDTMDEKVKAVVGALGGGSEGETVVEALRRIKNSVDDIEGVVSVARNESTSSSHFMKQVMSIARELLGGKFEDVIGALLSGHSSH